MTGFGIDDLIGPEPGQQHQSKKARLEDTIKKLAKTNDSDSPTVARLETSSVTPPSGDLKMPLMTPAVTPLVNIQALWNLQMNRMQQMAQQQRAWQSPEIAVAMRQLMQQAVINRQFQFQQPQPTWPPLNVHTLKMAENLKATMKSSVGNRKRAASEDDCDSEASASNGKRVYHCQRCLNHGMENPRKDHKRVCPHRNCDCVKCRMVDQRRDCNKKLNKIKETEQMLPSPTTLVNGESSEKGRVPKCQRCAQHSIDNRLKNHKRSCPFKDCGCEKCQIVTERQDLMARQIKLRRQQKKEKQKLAACSPACVAL